jgi:hypothetical protein
MNNAEYAHSRRTSVYVRVRKVCLNATDDASELVVVADFATADEAADLLGNICRAKKSLR